MIGGDPGDLKALATRLRTAGTDVATTGTTLRSGAGVKWESTAGATFKRRLEQAAGQHDAVVAKLDSAAAKVDALARDLEGKQHEITSLLKAAGKTLSDLEDAVGDGVSDVLGAAHSLASKAKDAAKGTLDTLTGGLL